MFFIVQPLHYFITQNVKYENHIEIDILTLYIFNIETCSNVEIDIEIENILALNKHGSNTNFKLNFKYEIDNEIKSINFEEDPHL